ncbi:MAG: substrate-binding domain-containing protein [Thermodesulfovibrionales bacterium]
MRLLRPANYLNLLLLAIFCVCATFQPASAETLTASGCSISMKGYLTDLAKEYERRTGVKVLLHSSGTLGGVEDLRAGKVDFAASCRSRTAGDPENIEFIQVAWGALVFITHKSNKVSNVSLDQVRAIYAGQITNWKQLNGDDAPIEIFIAKGKIGLSGVESSLREMVLKGKEPVQTTHTTSLSSSGFVEQTVEKTPEGFATTGFPSAVKRAVKILGVDGVYPSIKTIRNNRYPLKRPLFLMVPLKPKPEVRKFVDFVLSKEGQMFISSRGVISLLDLK